MEYFTIKDARTGQQTAVRFIGAVDAPTGEPPACPDLVGQGTAAGKALMRSLARGRADDASEVIGNTGYGMRGELARPDSLSGLRRKGG